MSDGSKTPPLSEAFCMLTDLQLARGHKDLKSEPQPFEFEIDEKWRSFTNASNRSVENIGGDVIPPWSALLFYGDFPAGFISPFGGALLVGAESDFIDAVKAQIDKTTSLQMQERTQ